MLVANCNITKHNRLNHFWIVDFTNRKFYCLIYLSPERTSIKEKSVIELLWVFFNVPTEGAVHR